MRECANKLLRGIMTMENIERSGNILDSIKLEETIIGLANGYLKEMEYHSEHLRTEVDDFLTCFQKLTTLTEISHLAESGLSKAATKALLDINQEATKLITRNEQIGIAINSNCATKLIIADVEAPVYTVLSRNNIGEDSEIKDVESLETAERMAKKLRITTNHMVCIDSANGARLKRWDRQRYAGENKWQEVDTREIEILGPVRELHRR